MNGRRNGMFQLRPIIICRTRRSRLGLGPDGCRFLLVFDDGNFNEFETFLLTDWLAHIPGEVLSKNFSVPESTFANVPKRELFIFQRELPDALSTEQAQAAAGTGAIDQLYVFRPSTIKPHKVTRGGRSGD